MTPPRSHHVTTAHLQAAYPFQSEGGIGASGVYVGRDLFGGSFLYDPWELYRVGVIANPNMVVGGQVGYGKSSLVKTYVWRQQVFGRHAFVVSPKPHEYDPLATALGTAPVRIAPGSPVRLNPLDGGPGGDDAPDAVQQRREELLLSLAEAAVKRPLQPEETTACGLALSRATRGAGDHPPVLPGVVEALLWPQARDAEEIATSRERLAGDGRQVGLALRRMVTGDLRGMFDGPTTPGVSLDGPVTVLDLSALFDSDALGILMACATAWLQAALARRDGRHRIVVVDEAWAILSSPGIARWLRQSFKLSRSYGVQNVAVVHRLSDLSATGARGSHTVALAEGLLEDTETRVVLNQPHGQLERATTLLGLSDVEAAELPHLPRGRALWKVGSRSFLVDHLVSAAERALIDTDAAMAGRALA